MLLCLAPGPRAPRVLVSVPAAGRASRGPCLSPGAVAVAALSASAGSSGSAPGSFLAISRVAWRAPGPGCTLPGCVFASRGTSRDTPAPSGRSSDPLPAGSPFPSGSPPLSPVISLRQR